MANHKHNNDNKQVLNRIMEQYPEIHSADIQLFTKVQYPIAILEIEMTEKTFEDFDLVQLTVLKLVNSGFGDAEEIADLIGLERKYVQKMLDLLRGYGHITASGITELGRESLREDKKITCFSVKQRFQADALCGDLLRLNQKVREDDLTDKDDIDMNVPVAPHVMGVSKERIQSQLSNPRAYKRYQGKILNANVEDINDVQCKGIYYADTYMLKLANADTPFIFLNQFDQSQKGKDRFGWAPIRLLDRNAGNIYGFDESIPCYDKEAYDLIMQLYNLVIHRAYWEFDHYDKVERPKEINDIEKDLGKIYAYFNYSYIRINKNAVNAATDFSGQITINIDDQAFTRWNNFVFQFLEYYDPERGFFLCNPKLNGVPLHFVTWSEYLISCSQHLRKVLEKISNDKHVQNHFQERKKFKEFLNSKTCDFQVGSDPDTSYISFDELETIIDSYNIEEEEIEVEDIEFEDSKESLKSNISDQIDSNKKGEPEDDESIQWYIEAGNLGDPFAQNYLGNCYYDGNKVKQDYVEATKQYRKAADQGDIIAQNNLGNCYYKGEGVDQDYIEAFKWYQKAAVQGYSVAEHNLGNCYYFGNGVAKDSNKADEWYQKAEDHYIKEK